MNENDVLFMNLAIDQAKLAEKIGEVPVGAVVVCDGEVVGAAFNTRETDKNALCHAEIKAINAACAKLGGWRLHKCDIYVTLEPCPMCAGAIINSRIKRVIYGACDEKAGAFGTKIDLNSCGLNHRPEVFGGFMEKECSSLLSNFFATLRENKKTE